MVEVFNCSDTVRCSFLVELLFTILVSSGYLERCFSQMKILKTDKSFSAIKKGEITYYAFNLKGHLQTNGSMRQVLCSRGGRRSNRSFSRPSSDVVIFLDHSDDEDKPQVTGNNG